MDFEELFSEQFSFVWRCLRGLGVPVADVDDLVQEVFLVVHRRMNDLLPDQEVRPWLYGILRYVGMNHWRAQKRTRARELRLAQEPPPVRPRTPDASLEAEQAAELVTEALGKLEENRREVFLLVELEGMSVVDVAQALGVPLNTAYSRLRLAREDFRRVLKREAVA